MKKFIVILATFLVFGVTGIANTALLSDDFNDNSRDTTMWEYITEGGGSLSEVNERLEYTSPGATPGDPDDENRAYYVLRNALPYSKQWQVLLDVHVADYSGPRDDHEYGIGIEIFNADDLTDEISFDRYRGWGENPGHAGEYWNDWWVYKATDDNGIIDQGPPATGSDGTLLIVWDGISFSGYYDEGEGYVPIITDITVADWSMDPNGEFYIQTKGGDTGCYFSLLQGDKIYMDNFSANIVPIPCETWTQVNVDGFGDTNNIDGRFIVFNGYLYSATENYITGVEIWRTQDGAIWEQGNQDGFGDPNNSWEFGGKFIIFQNQLYFLVGSDNTGVEVWTTPDGTTWEQVNQDGFGDPNNKVEEEVTFQNYLYVATVNEGTGTEVWRTPNGSTWEQVNQDGFGDCNNYAIWSTEVFASYLYFATANEITGTEVWRTPDGTTWEQVNQDGFGNSGNNEVTDFIIFGDYLYASTSNREVTGTEVWRTTDGATWIQVNYNGFGDINNDDGSFTIFNNLLYTMTDNDATGTEIWVWTYRGDFDCDGDVDGVDLATFAAGGQSNSIVDLAQNYGKTNCQ